MGFWTRVRLPSTPSGKEGNRLAVVFFFCQVTGNMHSGNAYLRVPAVRIRFFS